MNILYSVGWAIARIVGVLCRMRVDGIENIPASGSFILAVNHISFYDPPLVGSMARREFNFLGKDTLFKKPMVGRILKMVKVISVKRGTIDRRAIEQCVEVLQKGESLILFPEGTRSRTGDFLDPKPGIGMIAHQARCTIVPAFVKGSDRLGDCLLGRKQLLVSFGDPITEQWLSSLQPEKGIYQKIADEVMNRIRDLRDSASTVKQG